MAKGKNAPKRQPKKKKKDKAKKSSPAQGYQTKAGLTHGEHSSGVALPSASGT